MAGYERKSFFCVKCTKVVANIVKTTHLRPFSCIMIQNMASADILASEMAGSTHTLPILTVCLEAASSMGRVCDEAMKAAGLGWLQRKAMKAALAVAPSSEKGTYVVKGQQVIMTDSNGEKDTLMLSQDGQYLSGKMDKDTPFKLKRKK